MKKSLVATLLVALLASSMVFAGFGGNVTASFGWDIDNETVGFNNANAPEIELTLNETAGEKKGEGAVYAEIKAKLVVKLSKVTGVKATTTKDDSLEVKAEIKDLSAKVIGDKWYVGITGAMGPADFAKSYNVDGDKKDFWNWKSGAVKVSGVEVGAFGYTAGIGFNKNYILDTEKGAFFTVKTVEYKLIEGLTAQAGATFAVQDKEFENYQLGFGGKVGYTNGALTANVATDMGVEIAPGVKEEDRFNAEIAADAKYDFVSANVYFTTLPVKGESKKALPSLAKENLLNLKAAADFASFKVPATLSVEMIDTVHKERTLGVNAGYTIMKGLKVGAEYKTNFLENIEWSLGGNVEYAMDIATFKAGVTFGSKKVSADNTHNTLGFTASAESTKLISGATLKLDYSKNNINLWDNAPKNTSGVIVASCKIAF